MKNNTILTDWSRVQLLARRTRQEKRDTPRQIPNVFANAATLPTRLVKGLRWQRTDAVTN